MLKVSLLGIALIAAQGIEACTAFQLSSRNKDVIYCRTMEFGYPLESDILVVPRETDYIGSADENKEGMKWKNKYGYVGLNQSIAKTIVTDGMNEKGLVVGCLYLPGYAHFEKLDASKADKTIGPWDVASFLLANCATVKEAKEKIESVIVGQIPTPGFKGFVLPLHYYVGDKDGNVIIIEYVMGKRFIFDNPLGVLTNSPPFDWHIANLPNYVNLSPVNITENYLRTCIIQNISKGTGMLGLPGDFTPPSRFVRATLFSQAANPPETAEKTVNLGFHILNSFDLFDGLVREKRMDKSVVESTPPNEPESDVTQWVVVHDRTNLKTYVRTYSSLCVQMIDFAKIDFNKPGMQEIPLQKAFKIEDCSSLTRPVSPNQVPPQSAKL